jgi:hypothetical protein
MAAYLSNLVDRSNQPNAGVRARPISLFEPQTNFDFTAWSAAEAHNPKNWAAVEQTGDPQGSETQPDSLKRSATSAQPYVSRSEFEPRPRPVLNEQRTLETAMTTSKLPAQLGYLVVQPRFQTDQPALEPSYPEIIPAPQADRPGLEPERGANLVEGTPPRGGPATHRQEKTHQKPTPKTVIRPHLREVAQSPRSILFNPQITAKNDSSPTEPVINITIGSVEVLAVPPTGPAKTPKPSRSSPVMSLDEYLKNRDQERQP